MGRTDETGSIDRMRRLQDQHGSVPLKGTVASALHQEIQEAFPAASQGESEHHALRHRSP